MRLRCVSTGAMQGRGCTGVCAAKMTTGVPTILLYWLQVQDDPKLLVSSLGVVLQARLCRRWCQLHRRSGPGAAHSAQDATCSE